MGANYANIMKTSGLFGLCAYYYGISTVKNQFQTAKLCARKKGSSIDCFLQTAGMGEFEFKIVEISKGAFNLDEINYDPKSSRILKMNLYKNSGTPTPMPSSSPFIYRITAKNKKIDVEVSVNYTIVKGKTKITISPNKSGFYQVRRINIYDNAGRIWLAIPPPKRKSASVTCAPLIPSSASGSSGKHSP